ncbi:hypothetical protein QQS21_011044 [Conoideocrella luteorostrata]|uniref:BZIP domain-containing protein n=1 Tax=Conoideocrella luteorostrata TaxID=1105319 RepID=A0AAJ0CDU5_9HYPO|nr:hypothetical protein QQS21_011044 [Conoideocrella luteorostrata]
MPRKDRAPASKTRNRENQQRSRARQREFIGGLKNRLEEYERRGVAASLEMQMAARAANAENRRLRALLRSLGASSNDISAFLASFDHCGHGEPSAGTESCNGVGPIRIPNTSNPEISGTTTTSMPLSPASSSVQTQDDEPTVTTIKTLPESTEVTNTELDECRQARTVTSSVILSEMSDCFCPREQLLPHASTIDTSETSCDVAAAILVELHNETDAGEVRIALGCTGTSDCSAKNTRIFQLMDNIS